MAENVREIQEHPKYTDDHPLHFSSFNVESNVDKEVRLRSLKERQNEERQKKLEELKAQALAAQRFKEQKEHERRRRLDEMRVKDDNKRQQVEDRKRAIHEAERDRLESIIRRNQQREQRIETKRRNERSSIVFAFGSSTPRMLDPTDVNVSFWGHRRATSTQNITSTSSGSTLTRRQSERDLDVGNKKRATSAGGLERAGESLTSPTTPAGCASGYLGRRRTDLVPTIPSRDASFHSSTSRKSLNHSPGRAYSMSRLDQLAKPRKPLLPALNESNMAPKSSVTRSMSHLAHVGTKLSPKKPLSKADSRSMHQLSPDGPVAPPRVNRASQLRQQKLLLAQQSSSTSEASSRPSSSMSQQSTNSVTHSANIRHRISSAPRKPRPASIAVTGVSHDFRSGGDKGDSNRPPIPKTRKPLSKTNTSEKLEKAKPKPAKSPVDATAPKIVGEDKKEAKKAPEISQKVQENKVKPVEPEKAKSVEPEMVKVVEPEKVKNIEPEIQPAEPEVKAAEPEVKLAEPELVKLAEPELVKLAEPELVNLAEPELVKLAEPEKVRIVEPEEVKTVEFEKEKSAEPEKVKELTPPLADADGKVLPVHQVQEEDAAKPQEPTLIDFEQDPIPERAQLSSQSAPIAQEANLIQNFINTERSASEEVSTTQTTSETAVESATTVETKELKQESSDSNEMTASMSKPRITTEEEAKAALAERRRLIREEAERQAELERQRIEAEAKAEFERQQREEEQARALAEMQRQAEQERLQEAIREVQKREEEERLRREEEQRQKLLKEEADRKAKEEAERQKAELQKKLENEEKEREERRRRVEMIMSRTRGKTNNSNTASPQNSQDKNENTSENKQSLDENKLIEENILNEDNKVNENKLNEENKLNGTKQENGTTDTSTTTNGKEVDDGIVDNIIPDESVKNANTVAETINSDSLNSNNAWQTPSQQYDF